MTTTTQIFYLNVDPDKRLDDRTTQAGRQWASSLDLVETAPGFQKLYWGRRLEEPEQVQLHIGKVPYLTWESIFIYMFIYILTSNLVWPSSTTATAFRDSPLYAQEILALWTDLTGHRAADDKQQQPLLVRHTTLTHQVLEDPFGPSLLGYPIGTAVYKDTSAAWHEGAWPLWTHVVRHVDGCKGIAGGRVAEPVDGAPHCYVVYVAWASVAHHDAYHHTPHFRKHFVILNIGHRGYAEYGHVVFREIRERKGKVIRL